MHSVGSCVLLACHLLTGFSAAQVVKHELHKICVPFTAIEPCEHMVEQAKAVGMILECVPARDRIDCISKVRDHIADFEAVEPEDMYVASQMEDKAFRVFMEVRTKEEPEAEFRYEGVAVVQKDLDINNIKALKGLRSCHTGVGRNVGYKIPITKLTKMGILGPLSDTSLSPRENELKALSGFFSKACLVGTWSPHPETNARLKKSYSNLCALCEDPEKCDYPDANSGYEGALRCLAKAGGQIAWTKVIFVKKFFGMAYGSQPASPSEYRPEDFAYLCPDGSKRPLIGPPCVWAARPWPGFISSNHVSPEEIQELRDEIIKLNDLALSKHADWIAKVLILNNKTVAVNNTPLTPLKYLEKAKYKDVIERDVLEPRRVVRLCVQTPLEVEKCELLSKAAYSRDIRPSLSCLQRSDCLKSLLSQEAEVTVLDPHQALTAHQSQKVVPLLSEEYKEENNLVAVVRKDAADVGKAFEKLKGKKACTYPSNTAGSIALIKFLKDYGLLSNVGCPYEQQLSKFFSSVYHSPEPLKCLDSGKGDVAFVSAATLHEKGFTDKELVCSSGRTSSVPKDCLLATIPPRIVVARPDLSEVQTDEVRQSLLSAADLYGGHPELFRLFGDFNATSDVIFTNHATGLVAFKEDLPSYSSYKKTIADLPSC